MTVTRTQIPAIARTLCTGTITTPELTLAKDFTTVAVVETRIISGNRWGSIGYMIIGAVVKVVDTHLCECS